MILYMTHSERRALISAIDVAARFVDENSDFLIAGMERIRFRAAADYDWIEKQIAHIEQFHICHLEYINRAESDIGRCVTCGLEARLVQPRRSAQISSLT